MFNDELSKQICKIGGPFVLLVCCPVIAWASYYVITKAQDAGEIVTTNDYLRIGSINLIGLAVGFVSTYKGYEDRFRR